MISPKDVTPEALSLPAEDYFDPLRFQAMFERIRTEIAIENTTAKTHRAPEGIALLEIHDREIVLEVPLRTCSVGHNLLLHFNVNGGGLKNFNFDITAKVIELNTESGVDRICVSFVQFNEVSWNEYQALFANRQEDILNFLKAAKGE